MSSEPSFAETASASSCRTSALLELFLETHHGATVRLGDLVHALGNRAFGALLLIFALPNILPMPPGTSTVLGLPLVLFAGQMALGLSQPWLPRRLAEITLARSTVEHWTGAARRWIGRLERLMQPRLMWLTDLRFERLLGGVCLVLAVILALPIPLGNMPPALAIVLMALGLLEKDGVFVLLGLGVALAGVALVGVVLTGIFEAALLLVRALVM